MASLMVHMVVFGLLAAISPVSIMVLISIMMSKKPVKNALAFLGGYTLFLIALGVIAVFVLHVGAGKGNHVVDAWIDIGLAAVCFMLIPFTLRKKKEKPDKGETKPLTATKSFTIGLVTMCVNTSTIVVFVGGAHAIVEAHLSTATNVLALAVLIAVTLISLLVPILVYVVFPKKSDRLLGVFRTWLVKHQRLIGVAIFVVFGVYLLVKGIKILV